MEEIWKDIPNLSKYQISNLGRVKSKRRITRCNKGSITREERIMKNQLRSTGYPCVRLRDDLGQTKTYSVHRLVAAVFIPNPDNKPTVDHINRNKLDNNVENLRWATTQEQQENKRVATGQEKIKIKAIDKFGTIRYYDSISSASEILNVDVGTICKVISDKYINKTGGGYYFERI